MSDWVRPLAGVTNGDCVALANVDGSPAVLVCLWCNEPLPITFPVQRRYCRDSHRVMAGRARRRAGGPINEEMQRRQRLRWVPPR